MRGSIKPLPPDFWRQLLHTLDMFKPLQTGIATLALLGVCTGSAAQWARKPSYYEDQQQPTGILANPVPPASSLPGAPAAPKRLVPRPDGVGAPSAGLPNSSPAQAMADMNGPAELPSLANRADFDRMARVYNAGTPLAQPHVIFVIDRQPRASTAGKPVQGKGAKPAPQLHFVNTPRFQLHDHFVRETGLFAGSPQQFNRNYEVADRRLILGTLSWQPQIQAFVYEFWEGDRLTPELLAITANQLKAHFFAPVRFKANALAHEQVAQAAGMPVVTQAQLIGQQSYLPLNVGQAVGRLRIVADLARMRDLQPSDIVVLRQVPLNLPPVAGVITEKPSTLLSHVNLLAKGWGIPNAYVKDASRTLAALDGQWVHVRVAAKDHAVRAASAPEREAAQRALAAKPGQSPQTPAAPVATIAADLRSTQAKPLATLRASQRTQCGAKAANLGEVQAARIAGVQVPDGFCIPFGVYAKAMAQLDVPTRIARMQATPGFAQDADVRRKALAQLRREIETLPLDAALAPFAADWQARWSKQLKGAGVFVRSSSSSEDLANFSGAGLYTTVPNVRSAGALTQAVRQVWASVFNFEAWEARQAAGITHDRVHMAVLVQAAVDAEASGVMVTRSPLGNTPYTTYIAAKRGLGIRVVDGQRVAEQVLYSSWSKAVQVISQSAEDSALQLDPQGGVREVPLAATERTVLSDARVKRLAEVGRAIEKRFGGQPQDIEWALGASTASGQVQPVIVLQARPYVGGKR